MTYVTCSVASVVSNSLWPMEESSRTESSVHRILQARILEWVAVPSLRGSSWPRNWTHISKISCIEGRLFTHWATWEAEYMLQFIQKHYLFKKKVRAKNGALGHCKRLFPDRNIKKKKKKKSCQNKFCWSCRKQSVAPIHQANVHSRKGHFQNGRKLLWHFYSSLHSLPSTVVIRWKSGAQIHTIEPKAADQTLLANYCVHPFKLFWRISERMT